MAIPSPPRPQSMSTMSHVSIPCVMCSTPSTMLSCLKFYMQVIRPEFPIRHDMPAIIRMISDDASSRCQMPASPGPGIHVASALYQPRIPPNGNISHLTDTYMQVSLPPSDLNTERDDGITHITDKDTPSVFDSLLYIARRTPCQSR